MSESFEHLDATQAGVEMGRQLNGVLRRYLERVVVPEMKRREAAGASGDDASALLTGLGVEAMKGGEMFVQVMDEHFGEEVPHG